MKNNSRNINENSNKNPKKQQQQDTNCWRLFVSLELHMQNADVISRLQNQTLTLQRAKGRTSPQAPREMDCSAFSRWLCCAQRFHPTLWLSDI